MWGVSHYIRSESMPLFDDSKKKFEFLDEGFFYNGEAYKYIDIRHISYEGVVTDYKVNFISVDELKEALCEIELKNGKTIKHKIEEKQYLVGFSQDKTTQIKDLQKAFLCLLEKSFVFRLAGYLQEINQFGYFNCHEGLHKGDYTFKVYTESKTIVRSDGLTFNSNNSNFSRTNSEFIMTHKEALPNQSLSDKLLRRMFRVGDEIKTSISTKRDPDVFYFLIDLHLGIRFS